MFSRPTKAKRSEVASSKFGRAARTESLPAPKNFLQKRLSHNGYPLSVANRFWTDFWERGHNLNRQKKSPPYRGRGATHKSSPTKAKWQCWLSANLLCDALHRASPDAERLRALQNAHTLRKLLSHLPFGRAIYLRPAEFHALRYRALETCFDSWADHRPLELRKGAG